MADAQGLKLETWGSKSDKVFDDLCKQYKVADKDLKDFLKTWDGSGDIQEAFTAHLKNSANNMTFFQRATTTATTIGKKFIATLGSMAAAWAISEVISLAIKGIDRLANAEKYAEERLNKLKEKGEEAAKAIDELNDKFKSHTETVNKAGSTYAKYAESIHNIGKSTQSRGLLSTDQYKEFLEVSNELSDVFPELTTGYDDNGNALLNLGDNADTVTSKLKDLLKTEQDIANQEFIDKMPKVYEGYRASIKQNNKELKTEKDNLDFYNNVKDIVKVGGQKTYVINDPKMGQQTAQLNGYLMKALEQIGKDITDFAQYKYADRRASETYTIDFSKLSASEIEILSKYISNDILSSQNKYNSMIKENNVENARMASYYKNWAKKDSVISTSLDDLQMDSLTTMFDNIDWTKMPQKFEDVTKKIQMELLPLIQDNPIISDAFNNLFDPEQTFENYKTLLSSIQEYYSSQGLEIPAYLKLDYTGSNGETANEYVQDIIDKVSYELPNGDKITDSNIVSRATNELSLDDLEIAANVVSLGDSWDEVLEKIKKYKQEVTEANSTKIEPFKNITEATDLIKKDLSSAFKELSSAYTEIFEKDSDTGAIKFSLDKVNNEMLSSIRDAFDDLESFNTDDLNKFFETLTNEKSTVDDVQKAFNSLANSYLYSSDVMSKLNDETANSVKKQLEAMGITNADTLVNDALSVKLEWVKKAKENGIKTSNEFQNATYEEISALEDENGKLDEVEKKLVGYWTQKNIGNNITIMTNGDIQNLVNLMNASDKTCEKLKKLAKLKANLAKLDEMYANKEISADVYEKAVSTNTKLLNGEDIKDDVTGQVSNIKGILSDAQKEIDEYYAEFGSANANFNGNNASQFNSSKTSDKAKSDSNSVFDWIETRISRLQDMTTKAIDKITNYADIKAKRFYTGKALEYTKYQLQEQMKAYQAYAKKANSVDLSSHWKNLVQNGAYDISTVDSDLANRINKYKEYWEKMLEIQSNMASLESQIREYTLKTFDIEIEQIGYKVNNFEYCINMLNSSITKLETVGRDVDASYYNRLVNTYDQYAEQLKLQNTFYRKAMSTLFTTSEEYQSYADKLYSNEEKIEDLMNSKFEALKTISEIQVNKIKNLLDELDSEQKTIEAAQGLIKAKGDDLSLKDYEAKLKNMEKLSKKYYDQYIEYMKLRSKAISNGNYVLGREYYESMNQAWVDYKNMLTSIEELKDELRDDIYWRDFEKAHNSAEALANKLSKIASLINDEMVFDDNGALTDMGTSKVALLVKQYEVAKTEILNYQKDLSNLSKLYSKGEYTQSQYTEKLRELQSGLLDATSDVKSFMDSIVDLYEKQGNSELEALQKIISARTEALNKKKEYYDYDKNIRKKNKDIQSIEAQIAATEAMEDSLEKRKKLIQLQEQLNDAQDELTDTKFEHEITLVVNGLDDFMTNLQDTYDEQVKALKSSLEKQVEIVNGASQMYADSYKAIYESMQKMLSTFGIDFSSTSITSLIGKYSIGKLGKFATGGIVKTVKNTGEDGIVLTKNGEGFVAPEHVPLMKNILEQLPKINDIVGQVPVYDFSKSNKSLGNVNISYDNLINIEGNANSETISDLKKLIPQISDRVVKDLKYDLRKNGYK